MCINHNYINCFFRQGDTNSTILFAIFINDLTLEINNLKLGIPIDDSIISCLLYAEDLALIARNEPDCSHACVTGVNMVKNGTFILILINQILFISDPSEENKVIIILS